MKTKEALEKIYLFENPITETPDYRWLSKRSDKNDIEYTRTDAFIEKAVNWLINNTDITPTGIKNFRKIMKEE